MGSEFVLWTLVGRLWNWIRWLRIGTCGGLLWTRSWTLGFWYHRNIVLTLTINNPPFIDTEVYYHLKIAVFCVTVQCSPVEINRRFRGAHCLHHQSDGRHKILNWMVASISRF
jgi:hypothetical protein